MSILALEASQEQNNAELPDTAAPVATAEKVAEMDIGRHLITAALNRPGALGKLHRRRHGLADR